jgi:tryptophanyl-tRNA synthetase
VSVLPGQRVFSGIQPTGKLHLGNYLGAISLWSAAQAEHEAIFCIADLHALTTPEAVRVSHLRAKVRETAAVLLACGIDPARAILFVQSRVGAHAELAWLLSCVTPVGWLERMIQFKTRSADGESVGTGMLAYPVLQAADILLYRANLVPAGEDQRQHIELTRDIARRFHTMFGEVFTLPQATFRSSGARIMGLDDPSVKMSKSLGEIRSRHAIGLIDPPNVIRDAIAHAVTDSGREVQPERASPGVTNLLAIYELLSGWRPEAVHAAFAGKGYTVLKGAVADLVVTTLEPIRHQYLKLAAQPDALDTILDAGAERACLIAAPTLDRVKRLMGLDERSHVHLPLSHSREG